MADQPAPRRPSRPVVGSRNPTGRPRKVAGQQPASEPTVPRTEQPEDPRPRDRAPRGRRTTLVLVVALVLLIGLAAFEVFYLTGDDETAPSAARPVVTGDVTHRAAVEAAATSTEEILSTSYKNYDEQVQQATTTMTDAFAEKYRQTSDDIKDQFIAAQTDLQVQAVAQGVVRASSDEVQALLFLNQYVQKKDARGQPKTDYAQYRALVTVVHTDQGWLVSDIQTR